MLFTALARRSANGVKLVKQVALGVAMAAGGVVGGYGNTQRLLMHFAKDTLTAGVTLSAARYYQPTIGNVSKAVSMAGLLSGYAQSSTESYFYSTNTLGASSALTSTGAGPSFNNSNTGYALMNGLGINKYDLSADTVTVGTSLPSSQGGGSAFGNTSTGFIAGNNNSTTSTLVQKYTYAGDIVSAGINLSTGREGSGGSCSNSTTGVIMGGTDNTGQICGDVVTYNMATGAETISSFALGQLLYYNPAACNSAAAYSFAGQNPHYGPQYCTMKYSFTTGSVVNTTGLGNPGYGMGATSDSHGGL